jgi:hypothetical protein
MRSSVSTLSQKALKGLKTLQNKGLFGTHLQVGLTGLTTSI